MTDDRASRLRRIVEACVVGAHARHIELCAATGRGDAAFGAGDPSQEELAGLVRAHESLAAVDPDEAAAWADGADDFTALGALEALEEFGVDPDGRLPAAAAARVLSEVSPGAEPLAVRAWASLLQLALEVERDGALLQDQLRLYCRLGMLPTCEELHIEDDNPHLGLVAERMADASCDAPFDTGRDAWLIALRKIANWAVKHRGIVTAGDLADAVGAELGGEVIEGARRMPAQRILVLGHSYTMPVNWSTYAPFTEIAAELISRENDGVVFGHLGEGGMTASRCREAYFDAGLEWDPDRALIVVALRSDDDYAALEEMASRLRERGAGAAVLDRVHPDPDHWATPDAGRLREIAGRTGLAIIEVGRFVDAHPERDDFISLDGIHCRTSYHVFLAAMLVRFLASEGISGSR